MKHLFVMLCLFFATTIVAKSQNSVCKKWKTGRFYMITPDKVRIEIARKGGKQIEYNTQTGEKLYMKVKWLNACTYQLRNDPQHPDQNSPSNMVLTVKFYEFHDNYVMIEVTSNLSGMKLNEPFYKSDK